MPTASEYGLLSVLAYNQAQVNPAPTPPGWTQVTALENHNDLLSGFAAKVYRNTSSHRLCGRQHSCSYRQTLIPSRARNACGG